MYLKTFALFLSISGAISAAEPTPKISASFYAFSYVTGHESVSIRTGPEGFEEIRLSKANIVGPVNAVTIDNPQTAVIRLAEPHPAVLLAMSTSLTPIIPKHIFGDGTEILRAPGTSTWAQEDRVKNAHPARRSFRFVFIK